MRTNSEDNLPQTDGMRSFMAPPFMHAVNHAYLSRNFGSVWIHSSFLKTGF
jgi:hypothetical protein